MGPDDALATALRGDDVDEVARCLEAGAAINGVAGKLPPLVAAASAGATACMTLLLARGADVNGTGGFDRAPIHAVRDAAGLKVLQAAGADLNLRCAGGQTALHLAAANGEPPLIKALLGAGLDPNAAMEAWDQRPLQVAVRLRRSAAVKALMQRPPAAAIVGLCVLELIPIPPHRPGGLPAKDEKTLQALLAARPDLDALVHNGMRIVHFLAERGTEALTAQVLAAGADPNGRTADDLTGACYAAARAAASTGPERERCLGVVRAFAAAGADLDVPCTRHPAPGYDGQTARQILTALGVRLP